MDKIIERENKICPPHEYKAEKYQRQEAVTYHYQYRDYLVTTLIQEQIKLFCIKCGDTKDIE